MIEANEDIALVTDRQIRDVEQGQAQAKAIAEFKAQTAPSAYPSVKDGGDPQLNVNKSTRDQFADWLNSQD